MKHLFLLILLIQLLVVKAQNVEILGDLKLVNGTQGAGKFLMSDAAGNSNWVTSDRLLIESQKLKKGGIQRLLDWGLDPLELWENGVRADSIFGKNSILPVVFPGGGTSTIERRVWYLDTLNLYPWRWLAATSNPNIFSGNYREWGCSGTAIPGANGLAFLDGVQNTADHLAGCTTGFNIFSNLSFGSNQTGWSIASKGEAELIYQNAMIIGSWKDLLTIGFASPVWTSSEGTGADEATKAWAFNILTGTSSLILKTTSRPAFAWKAY